MGHFFWSTPDFISKSDRTGGDGFPAFVVFKGLAAFPRSSCAGFSPGVSDLNCWYGSLVFNKFIDAVKWFYVSAQIPASFGDILPLGSTAVASAIISPAPPTAREPRFTKCQSVATPSMELYWHIGETPIRLRRVMSLILYESNRCVIVLFLVRIFVLLGLS